MNEPEPISEPGGTTVAVEPPADSSPESPADPSPESSAATKASAASPLAWWVVGLCLAAVIGSAAQLLLEQPDQGYFALA
ncbi:MAG: hypothetical protein ACF8XB_25490, partial [Planctomycetota bacterium JB042]